MRYAWLQPTNVVRIAQQLLQMDKAAFEKDYQREVASQLIQLEEVLCQYLFPEERKHRYKYSPIDRDGTALA
jgi:hypothetical protein